MDNRPLELQAEKLIEHKLLKHNLLVNKPSFDEEGTDLLIIKDISEKITPFVKVQCKGRTIKTSSNVEIPLKYVKENFIVFLYIAIEKDDTDELLYVFFYDDIIKWQNGENTYRLYIPNDFQSRENFQEHLFNKESITKIENILLRQAVDKLIKTNHSIIIDGIFLEKAVGKVQDFYRDFYPEKTICNPSIDGIVEQCLKYVDVQNKEEVNCYLIYSTHFDLEYSVDIGGMFEYHSYEDEKSNYVGHNYNLFKLKTDKIVSFKVQEQLKRIINVENVILIADDISYVPYLDELKNKGVEVIVFNDPRDAESRMPHRFKWAKITYPLALSMGLEQYEL
jgi:hypothetical protein